MTKAEPVLRFCLGETARYYLLSFDVGGPSFPPNSKMCLIVVLLSICKKMLFVNLIYLPTKHERALGTRSKLSGVPG